MMSRDEARHAGFLNKAMSDFNLALDLGFLTKNRCVLVDLLYMTFFLQQQNAFDRCCLQHLHALLHH